MTLSKEQKEFIKILERSLGVVKVALDNAGVNKDTYLDWLDNPLFQQEVDDIKETSLDFVENQLIKEIKNGNMQAIQYYLKTKGAHRGYN